MHSQNVANSTNTSTSYTRLLNMAMPTGNQGSMRKLTTSSSNIPWRIKYTTYIKSNGPTEYTSDQASINKDYYIVRPWFNMANFNDNYVK